MEAALTVTGEYVAGIKDARESWRAMTPAERNEVGILNRLGKMGVVQ